MYGAHPNVIADNNTPLDVAKKMKEKSISELLINYGGQTISQLKKEEYKLQSLLPTLGEEAIAKSLLTKDDITMFEESRYTLKSIILFDMLTIRFFNITQFTKLDI